MPSDNGLDQLLRKAPAPAAPFGLEQRLIQQVSHPRQKERLSWSWFSIFQQRTWAPARALILVLAGLLTALAFQQNTLNELRQQQKQLAAQSQPAGARSQPQGGSPLEHELQLLQKQSAELQALRTEMAEIERLLAQQPELAAQNAALRAELSSLAKNDPLASPEIQNALAEARQKAERIRCVNNLKQIGLGARIWAVDNKDHLPTRFPMDFVTMRDELSTPKILVCPSDAAREQSQPIENWEQFATIGASYEMLSPGISEEFPSAVYVRCPFHNNVGLADGSVHQLGPEQQLVQRNGKWEVPK